MSEVHPSSFRDPSGFIFESDGAIYRQINQVYQEDYDLLMASGLYEVLVKKGYLIPHTQADIAAPQPNISYQVIAIERIPYISYPYEWCFSQYKDAALLTLSIQKFALQHGMILKDASAYNVQFRKGRAIFIDTLSLTRYEEGSPWVAYHQFCKHFLAPLALMALKDIRLSSLMKQFLDGVPLDLASKLLPFSTYFRFGLLTHIHIHASTQGRYSAEGISSGATRVAKVSKTGLIGIIDNLEAIIQGLKWNPKGTDWAAYYQATNYTDAAFQDKKQLVEDLIQSISPETVLDLGSNTGVFSRLAKGIASPIVSMDFDPGAVEINYREAKRANETDLLPLIMDLTNPSPDIGWHNRERSGFYNRDSFELVMALALVHHLAISNNLPLPMISKTLAAIGQHLIIEFVPKEDSQVQRLLASRADIFPDYTLEGFRDAFSKDFSIEREVAIDGTQRMLFLLKRL